MKRTIRLPRTLWKTATTLALVALTAGTALGNPFVADEDGGKKNEIEHAAHNHEDHGSIEDGDRQIPDQVTSDHWAYKEIADLLEKYSTQKKLPAGKPCPKGELAECLLYVLDKVVEKYEKEGGQAILRDDLVRISALHEALEGELTKQGGYGAKRTSIEEILDLIEPETPAFRYKFGVNGFLRGEMGGNLRLPDEFAPGHSEGRFIWRVKPYAYWHPTDYLDIHVEGQGYGFTGGNRDFDRFSLYQGYIEGKTPDKSWLALKGGRQEFVYGSAFIQGADSAFDGLSFDGARLRLQPLESLKVDLLGGAYAAPFSGGVKGNLWGAYATYAPTEESILDLYLFRNSGSEEHHKGEYLDTWGLRSTSKLGPLSLEIEPLFQSGKLFNPTRGLNETVNAYGGHVDLTGEAELAGFKNTFSLGYAVGSGDQNAADGVSSSKEFRNPNNDTSLVGDMHVAGDLSGIDVGDHHASGLQVYTLGWGIEVTDKLSFSATGHKFIANNVENGFSRHLGLETDFSLTYKLQKNLALTLAYDRFFTEKFFQDASGSGKDISYAYAMLTFNWDKTKRKSVRQ